MTKKLLKRLKKKYIDGTYAFTRQRCQITKVDKKKGIVTCTSLPEETGIEINEHTVLIWNLLNELEYYMTQA